jgi:exo-beta-1,3-glucanase (GH17 family)
MDTFKKLGIPAAAGICYSGFRDGQYPGGTYPTYDQVLEDLLILQPRWKYLRMYDVDEHATTTLEVIRNEHLDFKMLLGAYIEGEMNNFNCPWGGGLFTEKEIEANRALNKGKIKRLIELAREYPDIVFSLSVGNEACVEWTDHYVHEDHVLEYVNEVRNAVKQPVTFCENYVPWLHKLGKLAEAVDFISIHTYPVWEYRHIDEALGYTKQNYYAVAQKYPHKPVIITEAGWATNSNGRGINPEFVNETYQKMYFEKLMAWVEKEGILTFFFEAFDEPWKGSPEPFEPEKHWGLYKKDRTPKLAMRTYKEQNIN